MEQLYTIIKQTEFNLILIENYFKQLERDQCNYALKVLSAEEGAPTSLFFLHHIEKKFIEYNLGQKDISRLKIEFKDIFESCRLLLDTYANKIIGLPNLAISPYMGTASVKDEVTYLRDEMDYLPFYEMYWPKQVYSYCNKLYTLLNERLFYTSPLESNPVTLDTKINEPSNVVEIEPELFIEDEPIRTKLNIDGDYISFCRLFYQLYENGTKSHFKNSTEEIAEFIRRFFNFSKGKNNPTFTDIYLEFVNQKGGNSREIPTAPCDEFKLKWIGETNHIYFIFKKIYYKTKNIEEQKPSFSLRNTINEIGNFIFQNIEFETQPSLATIASAVGRSLDGICAEKNKPNINWDHINNRKDQPTSI